MGFSDCFLHMPDPGSVGPFMVNMLAAQRCTARLPDLSGPAANDATLLLSPRSALAGVPGYREHAKEATTATGEPALRLPLGAIRYDQPRHVVLELKHPLTSGIAITATIELHGKAAFTATSAAAAPAAAPELVEAEKARLHCADYTPCYLTTPPCDLATPPCHNPRCASTAPTSSTSSPRRPAPVATSPPRRRPTPRP